MKRRWVILSILVIIGLLIYASFFIPNLKTNIKDEKIETTDRNPTNTNIVIALEPPETVYKIYPETSHLAFGYDESIVKIILFVDFSNKKSIEAIKIFKEIISQKKDVSLYLYSFPIYQSELSLPLSNLFILSIKNNKMREFLDFIEKNNINQESITEFAKTNQIEPNIVFQKYSENDLSKLLALNDMNLGINFGVKIPPSYFINGVRIDGLKPKDKISEIVDKSYEEAVNLMNKGVNKDQVYNEIVKKGKEVAYQIKVKDRHQEKDNSNINNIYEEDLRYVPYKGPRFAPVTIILFVDYECPYSKRFYPILSTIIKKYPNDVRLFVKHYPLSSHQRSYDVARVLASALIQKKFWPLFEKIMEYPEFPDENKIYELASTLNIDIEQLKTMKDSYKVSNYVENDVQKGIELGLKVIPTMYINGVKYEGILSSSQLDRIITAEIKTAKKLLEEGLKYEELYNNLVKRNKLKNLLNKGIKKPYIEQIK